MARGSVGAHGYELGQIKDNQIERIAKKKEMEKNYRNSFVENIKVDLLNKENEKPKTEEEQRIQEKVDREDLQKLIRDMVKTEPNDSVIEEYISGLERFERFKPFLKSYITHQRSKEDNER